MNILLCLPFEAVAPKGNSIAARRLAQGFQAAGHKVFLLDWPAVDDIKRVEEVLAVFRPNLCLIMHAWRCAKAIRHIHQHSAIPTIVSLRGTDLNEMLDEPATQAQISAILSGCRGIVVFHGEGKKKLASYKAEWAAKTRVIANGANLPTSAVDYRARLHSASETFLFVTISGLREVKQPLLILPWLEDLRNEFPNLGLAHAGPPLEQPIVDTFREFQANHSWLSHLDQVPHEEIDSFLRAGQVYVSASRSEGMPHGVREAMLCGMPLLLSDIPGHRNMAEAEHEALFFGDRESFLRQVGRLLCDPGLRQGLGSKALTRAQGECRNANEIACYIDFFQTILSKGNLS
ncbi:MAG: glycosyltransferase family 4 protein [Candidatus Riflebacteria bacterium]|nr:glycosyltransferase family 4 protein [Candidatus Riflebacteria bacterium]